MGLPTGRGVGTVVGLRAVAVPFVVPGPSGVAVRTRLRVSAVEAGVLREVGGLLGSLASGDLAVRCRDGLDHDGERWAVRKRALTGRSSSRWAGSITKATHDQWALARRGLAAHIRGLEAGIAMVRHRLSLPVGEKGTKRAPGGYRSRREWHAKSRRLTVLEARRDRAVSDWRAGRVRVVRGGKRLANTRHHLTDARLTEGRWRGRWEAARMFLSADGESGKPYGNETIRITPDGHLSVKLPAPLAHLANAPHGRFALAGAVVFPYRGEEWADRIAGNRAVAYTLHRDPDRDRWYVTASWQRKEVPVPPLDAALAAGCIGVDMNDDHLAAWQLDRHGNPVGDPHRFFYDLSGSASHRDAQIRHALTRLLHWARGCGVRAIAVEDLNFDRDKTREKHGRRKRFRRLISRFPTSGLRIRLVSMAAECGLTVIAVDPAYTSRWGAQHWQKPLTTPTRKTTRHDAAGIAIGRRALGHPIRRRTAPPRNDQRDRYGHRTAQAPPDAGRCDGNRPPATDRPPGEPSPNGTRKRRPSASTTVRDAPRTHQWVQDSLTRTG
ncbi:IS200/IS605 family accessory protein TnpB-related protein [Streptomyces scopuliridis]|uniref:IS200/IS605 family accessory protein TnpB-related protein n=1 Tax=Streptomyces scopuliridis TaxID=452529 RepID=UPI0036CF84F0